MKNFQKDPVLEDIQSRMYQEAKSQQEAYALLQSGLKRHRRSGEMLSSAELKAILPHRHSLVLSTQERWLLEESRTVLEQQRSRKRRQQFKATVLGVGIVLAGCLAAWQLKGPTIAKTEKAAPSQIIFEKPESPPLPATQIPAKEDMTQTAPDEEVTAAKKTGNEQHSPALPETELQERGVEPPPANPFSYTIPVETSRGKVLRVRKAGKWGLADTRYNVLLPLKYRRVRVLDTTRGYFILELGSKRGIANAEGKVLLAPKYDKLGEYQASEHLLVVYQNGKAGLYDLRSGRPAIQLESKNVQASSESI